MLNGLKNAFRIKELREKILFTIAMLVVYRIGAHVPVPGIPFQGMLGLFSTDNNSVAAGAMALLNLFSGGALSYVSVFSLGIMPYITSSIILQMLQAVVPSLHELAREGEVGQTKITQYSRYLTLALAILNSVGYLFLFKSFGISFNGAGAPEIIFDLMIVGTLTAGAMLIMWIGELITQRGIGNGMSLIIFANIMAGLPQAIFSSTEGNAGGIITMVIICAIILLVIPLIVFLERGQRRIPVSYAKRVVGRRMMGGQTTYLPIKVNTAGVVPIIFASARLRLPCSSPASAGFRQLPPRFRPVGSTGCLTLSSSCSSRTSTPPWCSTPMTRPITLRSRAALFRASVRVGLPRPTSRTRSTRSRFPALSFWRSSPSCLRSSSPSRVTI